MKSKTSNSTRIRYLESVFFSVSVLFCQSVLKDQRCSSEMRYFLIFAAVLVVLQLQCTTAFSFSKLHTLLDKMFQLGTKVLQKNAEMKNEIVVMDILLQICRLEANPNTNTNNNNNINNINNIIESPTIQQPAITVIIMNNKTNSRPQNRLGRLRILRRKYKWQREYRFVIENDGEGNPIRSQRKPNRNPNGKYRHRTNYRTENLSARTNTDGTLDGNVKECIRLKIKELEKK